MTRTPTITTRFGPELLIWLDDEAKRQHATRRAILEAAVRCDQREQMRAGFARAAKNFSRLS